MNIRENLIFGLLAILLLIVDRTNALTHQSCNRSCPNPASFGGDRLPYPFGCSAGCEIQLNCSKAGIFIGEFPIQSINSESIRINLQSRCDRPLHTLHQLYSNNHAPTSRNAILLRNCTDEQVSSSCVIPSINIEARFQAPQDCRTNTSLTCYAEGEKNATFLEYGSVEKKGCKYLLSSISAQILISSTQVVPSVTLDVEVSELLWWLPGVCKCDKHAKCITVLTPNETNGYRCNCTEGFIGDGFRDGFGCRKGTEGHSADSLKRTLVIAIVSAAVGFLTITFGYFLWKKKLGRIARRVSANISKVSAGGRKNDTELPLFSLRSILAATNNFSEDNKLGEGGFGPVYKGILPENQEAVAIKRLSKKSGQGHHEFMNELKLIAKLQHTNLARLLGCCMEEDELILIYEYMPNRSLDKFLFDPCEKTKLDWGTRFRIIQGIAQGVLYIHKYSRLKIIHRDLKASNVLLDGTMNPKVSDFGMARIFDINQIEANTNKIVGTYGYMSPEYALYGYFSEKLDVFSFGILLLEIVSGKKNALFYHCENSLTLAQWIWELCKEGSGVEVIDASVRETCQIHEALRCIHVGLLCVQEAPADRPTMSLAIHMLEAEEGTSLPPYKEPAFSTCRNSSHVTIYSKNVVTITLPEPR